MSRALVQIQTRSESSGATLSFPYGIEKNRTLQFLRSEKIGPDGRIYIRSCELPQASRIYIFQGQESGGIGKRKGRREIAAHGERGSVGAQSIITNLANRCGPGTNTER